MLPNKNNRLDPDYESDGDTLCAEEIWPVEEEGPDKGKIKPARDILGNIIVDPAGNILKSQYLLDLSIFKNQ